MLLVDINDCVSFFRYLGPNTGNMHIVADLYAEVVGVVAQSRYFRCCKCSFLHFVFISWLQVYLVFSLNKSPGGVSFFPVLLQTLFLLFLLFN